MRRGTRLRARTGTQHNILSRKALSFAPRSKLSGKIVGIIVRCGPSALQLQARSALHGWHHFGPNIPDGHQNGLVWGRLISWNPVNALQSWRRLCDPNGSVRV